MHSLTDWQISLKMGSFVTAPIITDDAATC
jgi:hypothetical protein